MTPLSGPIQRSWLSDVTYRQNRPGILADPGEIQADDEMAHGLDRRTADVVAAADGEGQAVTFHTLGIGLEHDIGRRIVRIRVHRIRPVEAQRCGEPEIVGLEAGDCGHGC
jgi:hypothetical protein